MTKFRVEPCSEEHIKRFAPTLAQADLNEIWAAERCGAEEALYRAFRKSNECSTLFAVNGEIITIYGIFNRTLVSTVGSPWNFSCKNVAKYAKTFIKHSVETQLRWQTEYSMLENYVDSRHKKAVRWIKWLGYNFDKPISVGPNKIPFLKFWKRGQLIWLQQQS